MPAEYNLTERDYELLSAYIDGELPDSERLALERRLQEEDFLQRELAALQQSVTLINHLPTLRAPRDFTLDASMVELRPRLVQKPPPKHRLLRIPSPSMMSAVAAVFVVVFAGIIVLSLMGPAVGNTFSNIVAALDTGGSGGPSSAQEVAYAATPVTATEEALAREGAQPPTMPDTQQSVDSPPATGYNMADDEIVSDGSGGADAVEAAADFAAEDADALGTVGESTETETVSAPDASTDVDEPEEAILQPAEPLDTFAAPSAEDAAPPQPIAPLVVESTDSVAPTAPPGISGMVSDEATESPESYGERSDEQTEVAMGNGRGRDEDNIVPAPGAVEEVRQQDKGPYIAVVPTLVVGAAVFALAVVVVLVFRGRHA